MKKIVLFLMMVVSMSTISMASNDTLVTTSNVERLVDKYSEKVEAAIISLAQALKQPAEYVWKILIRQQYVKAVTGIVMVLLLIFFVIMTVRYAANIKDWDDGEVYPDKSKASLPLFVICLILTLVFLITTFVGGYPQDIIQGFINPEYGAMQEIAKFFK